MQFDRTELGRKAKEMGFVRDTFEKVCRLSDILELFEQDDYLSIFLALKGGTAINLGLFDLPKLSVDIDLDLSGSFSKEQVIEIRRLLTERIQGYMVANDYLQSSRTRNHYALDSFVFDYINSAGLRDNIKIEINYMLRDHVMKPQKSAITLPWHERSISVLQVDTIEIMASKIVALITRSTPRDLFDLYNFIHSDKEKELDLTLLRKCTLFYIAIGTDDLTKIDFNGIQKISQNQIKRDLVPVLKSGEFFDVREAQQKCISYLRSLLDFTDNEKLFWNLFSSKEYIPGLLFDDESILSRIDKHPMALWKCMGNDYLLSDARQNRKEPGNGRML